MAVHTVTTDHSKAAHTVTTDHILAAHIVATDRGMAAHTVTTDHESDRDHPGRGIFCIHIHLGCIFIS